MWFAIKDAAETKINLNNIRNITMGERPMYFTIHYVNSLSLLFFPAITY